MGNGKIVHHQHISFAPREKNHVLPNGFLNMANIGDRNSGTIPKSHLGSSLLILKKWGRKPVKIPQKETKRTLSDAPPGDLRSARLPKPVLPDEIPARD